MSVTVTTIQVRSNWPPKLFSLALDNKVILYLNRFCLIGDKVLHHCRSHILHVWLSYVLHVMCMELYSFSNRDKVTMANLITGLFANNHRFLQDVVINILSGQEKDKLQCHAINLTEFCHFDLCARIQHKVMNEPSSTCSSPCTESDDKINITFHTGLLLSSHHLQVGFSSVCWLQTVIVCSLVGCCTDF